MLSKPSGRGRAPGAPGAANHLFRTCSGDILSPSSPDQENHMPSHSRRSFLAGSLALPAAAAAQSQTSNQVKLAFRMLGKTGLKVTSLSFGCMTTSDASVIERAVDTGIVHFDTARIYQNGNNERMVGAA